MFLADFRPGHAPNSRHNSGFGSSPCLFPLASELLFRATRPAKSLAWGFAVKILIYGAGSVGLWAGTTLAKADREMTLVGRREPVQALRNEGIRWRGWGGDRVVPVHWAVESTASLSPAPFDLIVVAVKSFDTGNAVSDIERFTSPETIVVSLQDGLGNLETMAAVLGSRVEGNLLGATLTTDIELTGPAAIHVKTRADQMRIAPFHRWHPAPASHSIAALFREAGVEAAICPDIQQELWARAILQSAIGPLTALYDIPVGGLRCREGALDVLEGVVEECFAVAGASGVKLPWKQSGDFLRRLYSHTLSEMAEHRPMMWRDLQKGQRTEIDALNGYFSARGRETGVETPVNDWVTRLVRAKVSVRTPEPFRESSSLKLA